MGFLDRFKKKEEPKVEQQEQPVQLILGDERDMTATKVRFLGKEEVNGRLIYKVAIIQIGEGNRMMQDTLAIEPLYEQTEEGWIDVTEDYLVQKNQENPEQIKAFFESGYTANDRNEEKATIYIGGFQTNQDGSWSRYVNDETKQYYDNLASLQKLKNAERVQAMCNKNAKEQRAFEESQMEKGFQQQLAENIYPPNEIDNVQRLTPEMYRERFGQPGRAERE